MATRETSRFWFKNEKEVLRSLGLTPTKGSGSGQVEKEDGYNDDVLLQLKSTAARQITVHKKDVDDLVLHASVEHRAPVFAVNFIEDGSVWLMVRPQDVQALLSLPEPVRGAVRPKARPVPKRASKEVQTQSGRVIASSAEAREEYREEQRKRYEKKERPAK